MSGDQGRNRQRALVPAGILWDTDDAALFGVALCAAGKVRCRLIAEPLPGRKAWDWAVWHANMTRHGTAPSVFLAITAAKEVALTLLTSGWRAEAPSGHAERSAVA